MKVKYERKGEYQGPRMTIGKVYEVLGIECDSYRILDDDNDPCLYSSDQFETIDPQEPEFWVTEIDDDGDRYSGPFAWIKVGFFEDYHDGVQKIIDQFWADCERFYAINKNV